MRHVVVNFFKLRFLSLKFQKTYILPNFTIEKGRKEKKSNNVLDSTVRVMNVDHNHSLGYFTFTKVIYLTFPTTNLFSLYVVYSKRGSFGNLAKLRGHINMNIA